MSINSENGPGEKSNKRKNGCRSGMAVRIGAGLFSLSEIQADSSLIK
jgi:hypothetical protein